MEIKKGKGIWEQMQETNMPKFPIQKTFLEVLEAWFPQEKYDWPQKWKDLKAKENGDNKESTITRKD